ncbi:phosphoribosyltransferase family protein [Zafaria sp. Z1313]|uniref:phosphoribosyltransferase family protein n=1 Tax=unclassified Zafaria TaxID=2828765 RepID=UPI002E798400|nr:phosphoribosyltransferase family protein [Zafaria sp. J156]MEE1620810.1 phosphoribosyltransferase family protein [Zafaria sp. J156]
MDAPAQDGPTYRDRAHAALLLGRALLPRLPRPEDRPVVVLGLARGGVPIAWGVAGVLEAEPGRGPVERDVLVVRKLGLPSSPEVAFGAVAGLAGRRHTEYVPAVLAAEMGRLGDPAGRRRLDDALRAVEEYEHEVLAARLRRYLGGREQDVAGRVVVVCDDGIATGATLLAAVGVLREAGAAYVAAAAPVGAPGACRAIEARSDQLICPLRPPRFRAVGAHYDAFEQLDDERVLALLRAGHG